MLTNKMPAAEMLGKKQMTRPNNKSLLFGAVGRPGIVASAKKLSGFLQL